MLGFPTARLCLGFPTNPWLRGFVWFITNGYGKVFSELSVLPTQRVRLVRGTQPRPFLPHPNKGKPWKAHPRAHKHTTMGAQATIQEAPKPMFRPGHLELSRARGLTTEWPRLSMFQVKSPKKSDLVSFVRKARTNTQKGGKVRFQKRLQTGQGRLRWSWAKEYIQGKVCDVHLARHVMEVGDLSLVCNTTPPGHRMVVIVNDDSLDPLWWLDSTANDSQTKNRTSTVIERKPTPGHQHLAACSGTSSEQQSTR